MNELRTSKPPRIEVLKVKNYRALKNIDLRDITPLTVFVGHNGSGKSTLFDVFAFLSECFSDGLRRAWDRRGRFRELRSRDAEGSISIELKFREDGLPLVTYRLEIDEIDNRPFVSYETLQWKRKPYGAPFKFLEFREGRGFAVTGEMPDEEARREETKLTSPEFLAVNTLGQFEQHPRVHALREFITSWHLSYLSAQDTRGTPEAGPQEHLSRTGDNLANVIQYLKEQHPVLLDRLISVLVRRVPRLESVEAELMPDGRLLLQIKDEPFDKPILAKYASDGTLKLLSYLLLINDPVPPRLIGLEEPENFLHPTLLPDLAEECAISSNMSQLMVTTHSPFFLDSLAPKQVRVLNRGNDGYTLVKRLSDFKSITELVETGEKLGNLWTQGYFQDYSSIGN